MLDAKLNSKGRRAPRQALAVCLGGLFLLAGGHAARAAQEPASAARLLSFEEGRAIVNAAWEHRRRVPYQPDCSHLVHQIYQLAGFPYSYRSSFHLYAGGENFARVDTPQPGDLIVWRGHVGIVVDPGQRSFYSSLGSGLGTDVYDSRYWRGRGPPRFYRYVLGSTPGHAVAAAPAGPRSVEKPVQIITVPVIEGAREAPSSAPAPAAESPPKTGTAVVAQRVSSPRRLTFEIPPSILIVTAGSQPTRDEIAEAISELSNAGGEILRSNDILNLPHSVVIVDRLRVERVKVKRGRGWAQLRIESRVSIAGERVKLKRRREKSRWELRRTDSGWLAFTPLERVYVPRDVAVRVLAEQLALLTRSDFAAPDPATLPRQQARLARLLNALLKKN